MLIKKFVLHYWIPCSRLQPTGCVCAEDRTSALWNIRKTGFD